MPEILHRVWGYLEALGFVPQPNLRLLVKR